MGQFLTTGGASDPFLPRLLEAIGGFGRTDLAAAFVVREQLTGLVNAKVRRRNALQAWYRPWHPTRSKVEWRRVLVVDSHQMNPGEVPM